MTTHTADQRCQQPHFEAFVEEEKKNTIFMLGDVDCPSCLRRMAEQHESLAMVYRTRLATLAPHRCRVYDTACMNPSYCNARDSCCAGDPACRAEVAWRDP